ncbi:Flp family type IVb pilin [Erythrobacter sp. GH1-10]|uniref:Flp family type IVb pilin n=1 Tax=Erythrobacter sp. GH1-10 TaxID=3349334 RepID=UPI003877D499
MKLMKNFLRDESGASAAEYALILAVVGAGIAGAALFLGQTIDTEIRDAATLVDGAVTP